jgi:Flp pilus assembly pilin Flp
MDSVMGITLTKREFSRSAGCRCKDRRGVQSLLTSHIEMAKPSASGAGAPRQETGMSKLMARVFSGAQREVVAEDGQTMAEYGLILAGVAVVVMVVVVALGNQLVTTFNDVIAAF